MTSPAFADAGDLAAYLRARVADADGRAGPAAQDYAKALAGAPADPVVAIRAYRGALDAGDDALAVRAAAVLEKAGVAPADAALIPLSEAARRGDAKDAQAALARLVGGPLVVLAPSLQAWIAFASGGDWSAALATAKKDPVADRFATETRVLLGIATRSAADPPGGAMPNDVRVAAAQLLFGQGRDDAARTLLAGADPTFVALRGGASAKPTLAFGVSRLLTRVASDLAGGASSTEPSPLSIALARAALRADPDYDRPRLLLADSLARGRSTTEALAVLDRVDPRGPFASAALAERVVVLTAAGREADALAVAAARAQAKGATAYDWQLYADLLGAAGKPAEAAPYYRRVIDEGVASDGWAAWLQYGGALDQAGRWPEARDALEKAVARGPTQPLALNYLGYARVERGEDVAGATRMLERASALDPDNASITDSLGWAYHLSGDTAKAVPLLERAAAAEPGNAEIGEHLGDAYWTQGRRYEARYAWRAAALTADPKDAPRLATKIAQGLPAGVRR